MADLAAARRLAEDRLRVDGLGDDDPRDISLEARLARALLSALDALGEIERRANIIIENGGQPSPEAFAYLANLRDAYVAQIKALEAENRAALDALEAANKERAKLAVALESAGEALEIAGDYIVSIAGEVQTKRPDVQEALESATARLLASVAEPQKDTDADQT